MENELQPQRLSLSNLYQGAAIERFDHELQRVVENIKDINTDAEASRKIVLEVTFTPFTDRTSVDVTVSCKSTIAATQKLTDQNVFIVKSDGQFAAFTNDPRQQELFSPPAQTDDNRVVPMKQGS